MPPVKRQYRLRHVLEPNFPNVKSFSHIARPDAEHSISVQQQCAVQLAVAGNDPERNSDDPICVFWRVLAKMVVKVAIKTIAVGSGTIGVTFDGAGMLRRLISVRNRFELLLLLLWRTVARAAWANEWRQHSRPD